MSQTPKLKKQLSRAQQIAGSNIIFLQLSKEVELILHFILSYRLIRWLWNRSLKRYAASRGIKIAPEIKLGDVIEKENNMEGVK
jgi:hypothetical protein